MGLMRTVLSLPPLFFPLGVLLPAVVMGGLVAVPETPALLGYAFLVAFLSTLPALALVRGARNQPTTAIARSRPRA